MKKRSSEEFVKSLPKLKGNEKASPLLKKTIAVVDGKKSAETALIEPKKNEVVKYVGYVKTTNEKFWDWVESKPWGKWIALGAVTIFIIAVAYWGIKQ